MDIKKFVQRFSQRQLLILGVALALLVMDAGAYAITHRAAGGADAAQREADSLIAQIGTLIVLPTNEQPIIATVSNPDQLKGQPFFANAKKGDKLLIYNTAKKAILYNPASNRIVEVAPLSVGTSVPK